MTKYTDMRCAERDEHHEKLISDGFEWCPECGELLDWHAEPDRTVVQFRSPTAYVCGDCPPITSDDLLPIA